jgi:hypothetical protein
LGAGSGQKEREIISRPSQEYFLNYAYCPKPQPLGRHLGDLIHEVNMREELLSFDWHTYNLSDTDFDYTIELVDRIISERKKHTERIIKKIELKDKKSKSLQKDDTGEEISDVQHYSYIDGQFLWHFALWRLQGIFEGILTQNFRQTSNIFGLKTKLDNLKGANVEIADDDYNEILKWAKLRNALSHLPPEQYNPGNLTRTDLVEYSDLLKRIINQLISQKNGDAR